MPRYLALLLTPLLLAIECQGADRGPIGAEDAGSSADTGPLPGADAGAFVPGVLGVPATDADGVEPLGEAMNPPSADAERELDALAACYDESPDGGHCEEPACRPLGACCVGKGDCCAPTTLADLPTDLDLTSCAELSCLGTAWRTFGQDVALSDDGLAPQGTATGEGGGIFLTPIPLHSTRASFTFTWTPPEECGLDCLESLSVGLLPSQPPLGPGVTVSPPVALTYSGGRDSVALVLSGHERLRFDRGDVSTLSLTLEPTGRVIVTHGDDRVSFEDAFTPAPLHLAVWGRSRNPSASDRRSVALASLRTELALCDMPGAWNERVLINDVEGAAPSLASNGTDTLLAYLDADGSIRVAQSEGHGRFTPLTPRLDPTNVSFADRIDDPELVWRDSEWQLFFTARRGETASVGRATFDGTAFTVAEAPVLDDAWAPTLAASLGGRWVMIVRTEGGLEAFVEQDESFVALLGCRLNEAVAGLLGTVGNPSLVLHDRAWQLYVPVRRGTRWSVELLASDEALVWRHVGPTLLPSGQGFDRLGVAGADARAHGDVVEVVYEGDDGVRRRLGWASRPATGEGRR